MSIMAGIFSRDPSASVPSSACNSIAKLLSRNKDDDIQRYESRHCFIAKLDIGAYRCPAFFEDSDGLVSALTGEPLLAIDEQDISRNREQDLHLLHKAWKHGDWGILKKVNGLFCAAHYNPELHKLVLLCDKHGLRPFYYWEGKKHVIFSTALRVLESLEEVPKTLDLRTILQMQTLKFSLSNKTPYANIRLVQAGEILSFSSDSKKVSAYWRWDSVPCSREPEEKQIENLYQRFRIAIKRRLRNDKVTVCALSGGLDSRCIVGILRDLNVAVHTFNFAPPGTQDSVLASMFAKGVGAIHKEITLSNESDDPLLPIFELSHAWKGNGFGYPAPAERPLLVWLGAGGSVGLGHVYTTKRIVESMRSHRVDDAIDSYLKNMGFSISGRFLKPEITRAFSNVLHTGIREILDDLQCEDPARNFFLFFMLYEQRGLFSNYYEDIDLHRLEAHAPFLDSDFFEAIVASPIDLGLRHHLYHKWLKLFPESVYSIPWQAYPKHEPCPHPIPEGLKWQWDGGYEVPEREAWLKQNRLKKAKQIMKQRNFPRALARKHYFRLAVLLYRLGIRDYGWLIDKMDYISRYWSRCRGKYEVAR